jgi:hypothetical protein
MLSGAALAADSESTRIFAEVDNVCTITTQSDEIDLTNTAPDQWAPGEFTYQCNFVGSPTLTFASLNGGLLNPSNGTDLVDYGIYLNDAPAAQSPSGSLLASNSTGGGFSYSNITATTLPNQDVSPFFQVGPLDSFDVAGVYEDVLTISIAP